MRESYLRTLTTAAAVCLACSLMVSAATVALRPFQERNRLWDRKRNVLLAAGLIGPDTSYDEANRLFAQVEVQVIDLESGMPVEGIDPGSFDPMAAQRDPKSSTKLPPEADIAGLKTRGRHQAIYVLRREGRIERLVLPVHGKGLWSTMWGLIALGADLNTIESFAFFEHAETPGLGGEVDNPRWKALWVGKRAFDSQGQPRIEVVKGRVDPASAAAEHQVDGLSGATLTGRGVTNLLRFWLSEHGYGPLLKRLRAENGCSLRTASLAPSGG